MIYQFSVISRQDSFQNQKFCSTPAMTTAEKYLKPDACCAACLIFSTLIIGIPLLSVGIFSNHRYDQYLQNQPLESICDIFNVTLQNECEYNCNCHLNFTSNDISCDTCYGKQYIFDAFVNTTITNCDQDDYKYTQYHTECNHTHNIEWFPILDILDMNETFLFQCWLPNDCNDINTFYTFNYNEINRPSWMEDDGDYLIATGGILMGVGALILCYWITVSLFFKVRDYRKKKGFSGI